MPAIFWLCVQVFFSRILDVSLGTIRTILTVRGKLVYAAVVGFVEVMLWFIIVRSAIQSDEGGLALTISFAAGFASGTFIGGKIAERFIGSLLSIQVITSSRDLALISAVRTAGFAVTVLNAEASEFAAEKHLLVIEIKSDQLKKLKKIIYDTDPGAFIMARETKFVHNGFLK